MSRKNILIIGAGKGIGLASAKLLSLENEIYAVTKSESLELEEVATMVKYASIADESAHLTSWLPEKLDALIFCPGTIRLKPFHRISHEEFLEDFQLNVLDAIATIQACLPLLKKSEDASVVLFSSVAAQVGMSFHSSISSSKAAIEGLTKSLAAEYAPTIRFNCIAPSLTLTSLSEKLTNSEEKIENANQRHPLKRIGTVEDLAEMVCFLSSYKSSWITGQIFHVDGGMSSLK
ncbi:MAG: SDR family NAD(P)-dependent oxidoreductase [Flavobacteriia bacterium]|jgi:3-oxoacyl-[acyl-carrier protein] reductase